MIVYIFDLNLCLENEIMIKLIDDFKKRLDVYFILVIYLLVLIF